MVKPFSFLPTEMNKLSNTVRRGATRIAQQVATGIGATVVDTTRVDTGAARSNWRASLDFPLGGTIPPYAPGNKLGSGETANASAAKDQQRQVIKRFEAGKNRSIFITNNIPYIGRLNNGDSLLAPGLMVEQGLQTGRAILSSIRILDSKARK